MQFCLTRLGAMPIFQPKHNIAVYLTLSCQIIQTHSPWKPAHNAPCANSSAPARHKMVAAALSSPSRWMKYAALP